jgi:hypothetical protein
MALDFNRTAAPTIDNSTNSSAPTIDITSNKKISLTGDTSSSQKPTPSYDSSESFEQKYNELFHKVQLYLDNSGTLNGGDDNRFTINPAAVLNLNISDTVNDWVVDGSILFMYLPEDSDISLKKTGQTSKTAIEGAKDNGQVLKSYQFRGDGFDLLRVKIVPKATSGDGTNTLQIGEDDPKWALSYVFSVYDVEDVSNVPGLNGYLSTYMKCMKLYIRDIRYHLLKTINLEYSTTNSSEAVFDPKYDSVDATKQTGGVLKTGTAMLDVLNEAISNSSTGTIDFLQYDDEDWDTGSTEIFYTSPAEYSALDDFEYLYAHHLSENTLDGSDSHDLCLLHTKKAEDIGYVEPICLTPIKQLFEKAGSGSTSPGELQVEHFFVTDQTDYIPQTEGGAGAIYGYKAPIGGNSSTVDIKTAKYGQILAYSFVDMSAEINNTLFTTTPVYSVNINERKFKIEFEGNEVTTARKAIANTYINQLYKEGSSDKLFLPTIHQTKEKENIFPVFSLHGDNEYVRQKKGIGNLIYTGLFQNACICFKVLGLTIRESGTFIGVDRTDGSPDNDYSNKVFGQYFVVKVDHIFEAGGYTNVIWAIKLHRFKESSVSFGDIL